MRYALVYGGLSGAIVISVLCLGLFMDMPNHAGAEWFGYLVMLVALSMIFIGIKRYRDVEKGGVVRFLPAFGLGLGIAAFAALIYVAGWEAFLALSGRDFIAEFTAATVQTMRANGASPAAIMAMEAEMRSMAEAYRNPLFRVSITFLEIFPVGFLVALVSAAILRNPRVLPARPPASAAA